MKLTIYHPQGNSNVRESAVGFVEAGLLHEYHTSIACFPNSFLDVLGSLPFLSEVRRRKLDDVLAPYTKTWPALEVGRLFSKKIGFKSLIKNEESLFSVEAVTRRLDKKVAGKLKNNTAVYAYEDGAYFSFITAKRKGAPCFYDLPTGYWRAKLKILEKEISRFPHWKSTMPGLFASDEKLRRKDEEITMADRIFVASQFTKLTLQAYPGGLPEIQVIPYGFPTVTHPKQYPKNYKDSPIKLLFVGSLSQQKGIANLFEAVESFGSKVRLTVIGERSVEDCEALNEALAKHQWIPSLSHHEILQMMREHDVFVFPTLFDGFGLVITEAMSQGTPVIATYNCAGPDLIESGKNGWLVEAGSTSMLRNIIGEIVENPELIQKAGSEAMETARKRPWNVYRKELSEAIKLHLTTA